MVCQKQRNKQHSLLHSQMNDASLEAFVKVPASGVLLAALIVMPSLRLAFVEYAHTDAL
jgi:hypothetical protein